MTTVKWKRDFAGTWLALAALFVPLIAVRTVAAAPQSDKEKLEREQQKRERQQEELERTQERREREQEKAERQTELYDDGQEALDEGRWDHAEAKFTQLAQMNGPQTDAALYWQAYAQYHAAKRDAALATIGAFKQRFAQSRWRKDVDALEIEVRQSSGQPVRAEGENDCELKMLAMQGAMNADPEKAMPILEKFIENSSSPRCRSKALFVLAQSGSPKARDVLGRIARGQSNPELQRKAVQYLGLFGGEESRKTLAEVYASTQDVSVKRAILQSYMVSGDRERLFALAKNEKAEELRRDAIRQLGLVHAQNELQQLYQSETSRENREAILQAFFLAGEAAKLVDVAQNEKDPGLRRTAIRNLGLIHSGDSSKALQAIYAKETDRGLREEVLNAYFLQGNATALVAIARSEKDPELKKAAVQKLSLMHSKEAADYLMELLNK